MLVVGFGDSITAGVFLSTQDTFLYKVGLKYGLDVYNAGVPGNTTSQAMVRMQADVLDRHPDICIVEFGMNDHVAKAVDQRAVDPATFEANLRQMITNLQTIKCIPILCTISPIIEGNANEYYYNRHPQEWYLTPPGAQAWIDQYSQIVRDVAADMNVRLADVAAKFADHLQQGGTLIGMDGVLRNLDNAGADDGVHPTPSGHDLYLSAIVEQIDTIKFGC
jgi:acyl-CoA thioesterase I